MSESMSSSLDPLSLLNESTNNLSPLKSRRSSLSPRKPLSERTNNVRVQDFYMATPAARTRIPSPRKSQSKDEMTESPWRIKVTVRAEAIDAAPAAQSPIRLRERTTTTRIPLKGGDSDDEASEAQRSEITDDVTEGSSRRGRPSSANRRGRSGTPKPKARRKSCMSELVDSSLDDGSWAPTPPRTRSRGRSRNTTSTAITTPTRRPSPESWYSPAGKVLPARPFTRRRSRSRRKEITPRKLSEPAPPPVQEATRPLPQEEEEVVAPPASPVESPLPESPMVLDTGTNEVEEEAAVEESQNEPKVMELVVDANQSATERSTLDLEDEIMWRSMIRQDSISPERENEEVADEQDEPSHHSSDPTEEHTGFDTILESEGFSMVSVDSLQSTSNMKEHAGVPADGQRQPPEANVTPTKACGAQVTTQPNIQNRPSPLNFSNLRLPQTTNQAKTMQRDATPVTQRPTLAIPPTPQLNPPVTAREYASSGPGETPTMERVQRAGAALQSMPSPRGQSSAMEMSFGSPFNPNASGQSFAEHTLASPSPSPLASRARPFNEGRDEHRPELFEGFSALSRRELQAGLRLGEELASKRGVESPAVTPGPAAQEKRIAASDAITKGSDAATQQPSTGQTPSQPQLKPAQSARPKTHLPSPATSEADVEDQARPPRVEARSASPPEPPMDEPKEPILPTRVSGADFVSRARELEWQRERDEIVRRIQAANSSQVIVVHSDDEDFSLNKDYTRARKSPRGVAAVLRADQQRPDLVLQPSKASRIGLIESSNLETEQATLGSYDPDEASNSDLFWQPNEAQTRDMRRRHRKRQDRAVSERHNADSSDLSATSSSLLSEQEHESTREGMTESRIGEDVTSSVNNTQYSSRLDHNAEQSSSRLDETIDQSAGEVTSSLLKPQASRVVSSSLHSPSKIDPALRSDQANNKNRKNGSETLASKRGQDFPVQQAQRDASKSWFPTFSNPLSSLFSVPDRTTDNSTALSLPAATLSDILASSPHEKLPVYHPWTAKHYRALEPLYNAVVFYAPTIFPLSSESNSSRLVGAKMVATRGWARTLTKADCGVIDAFLTVLKHRGTRSVVSKGQPSRMIAREDIARHIVALWSMMVMRGEVDPKDWSGVRYGERGAGDGRIWRETGEDVDWKANRSEYFERKRAEFERNGLPSWREKGLRGPFRLS